MVLGCTVGAGQTITTLMVGEVLANLRADRVAVLDVNPGDTSLIARGRSRPAVSQAASLGSSRLEILDQDLLAGQGHHDDADELADGHDWADARAFEFSSRHHKLVLADPSTSAVPALLAAADQLILVAPASQAAASAITMTFEWLDAHGRAGLAASAVLVMNGVSRRTAVHVEQAERVAAGRCRAIVRVPWDDQLAGQAAQRPAQADPVLPAQAGPPAGRHRASEPGRSQHWAGVLSPGTARAYTALAGVLVAGLAEQQGAAMQQGAGARQGARAQYGRAGR